MPRPEWMGELLAGVNEELRRGPPAPEHPNQKGGDDSRKADNASNSDAVTHPNSASNVVSSQSGYESTQGRLPSATPEHQDGQDAATNTDQRSQAARGNTVELRVSEVDHGEIKSVCTKFWKHFAPVGMPTEGDGSADEALPDAHRRDNERLLQGIYALRDLELRGELTTQIFLPLADAAIAAKAASDSRLSM